LSGRLRICLIAGCALLSALHAGEARATLAQGLWGGYDDVSVGVPARASGSEQADGASASVDRSKTGSNESSGVALRELEPFLSGLGVGL
jgi:hypothetical protein